MANLNKLCIIGRLTRDVECRTFGSGGKVAQFGVAMTQSRKKQQDGSWKDEPCFVDCKAFNRETGRKLADLCEQYLRKGSQVYIEGKLTLEQWQDKNTGDKRSKHCVVIDDVQFLDTKKDGETREPARETQSNGAWDAKYDGPTPQVDAPPPSGDEDSIPF